MAILLFALDKRETLREVGTYKRIAKILMGNEDTNYMKNYDVIEESKDFDENKLFDHFKWRTNDK